MKRIFFSGSAIVICFFALWLGLSRLDWMEIFKVKERAQSTEEKLGKLYWKWFENSEDIIRDRKITRTVDSILTRICDSNDIDKSRIKLHIIASEEVNAFALPDRHMVILSNLIISADNEAELAGVMSHELAHMELNHVMKRLVREVGLSTIISMTAGNGGGEIIKQTAKMLSSAAYDRSIEEEADKQGVEYLIKARIDAEGFANFMYKIASDTPDDVKYLSWISTHPDSQERAEYIIEYSKDRQEIVRPVLRPGSWERLVGALKDIDSE